MAYSFNPFEDPIERIVHETIDSLIEILESRRYQLINQVKDRRARLESDVKIREQMKTHLKTSIQQLEANLRENPLQNLQHKIIDEMQQKIEEIELEDEEKSLKFICETSELEESLATVGKITVEIEKNNSSRYHTLSPKVAFGTYGSAPGEFACPESVTVNVSTNEIFVADSENGRVQIFTEFGRFVNEFGRKYFKLPYGIAIYSSKVFVSDWGHHCIFQFTLPELKFIQSVGKKGRGDMEFDLPRQITASEDGRILVADCNNNRIGVFDCDMEKVWHIKHSKLSLPCDVKATPQYIYVLSSRSDPCIHIFTPKGGYLTALLSQGPTLDILKARYFCVDSELNVIISDHDANNIKIFSPEGKLIHTLGKKGQGKGTFQRPQGVAMLSSGELVSVSSNYNFCIQIFS